MDDLVTFLRARLDEDERELVKDPPHGLGYANLTVRVHREITAKRAIVALHKTDIDPADALYGSNARCEECGTYVVLMGPCKTLRILAAVYSDHPDYRAVWT